MPQEKLPHLDTSAVTSAETFLSAAPSGSGSLPPASADSHTTVLTAPAEIPRRIGRYEIKRLIGSGGMGAVYEAVQDQPRRTVALKVMRSAMASPMALRRFEYESQLLAKLRHPGIAQVYDAGTHQDALTLQSVPFFAMEYVPDARPLTAYAEAANLPLRARLELFLTVCDAVQHGHQRAVIHRDLKPANILVDQQGGVKIIDFGVARSAEAEGHAMMTQHTSVGQLVGTLQYMSPEQCGADTTDIDSRADVYALGVTLYELLTGKLPYELSGRSLAEAVRIIRESPPTSPSQHRRELRGDLQTIILKALEKEPASRYESASALAADIQRYLNSETILARKIGVPGRFVRWVKRNRAVATVGGVALLVLATTSVVLAARIINENRRANAELARANDNMARIKDMFASMVPDSQQHGLVDVSKILDGAAQRMKDNPPAQPATEADFREFLSKGYLGLSQYSKAVEQQQRVVEIREGILPDPSPVLAESLHQLGADLWWNGQYEEADKVYTRSLAMRRKLYGAKHPEIATSLTHLAACRLRQGRLADAEELYTEALDMRRELLPAGSPELAASVNNLAKCVQLRGHSEQAETLFRQALEMITSAKGESDLQTASAAHNLGLCLLDAGKAADAQKCFQQALKIRTGKLRPTHLLVCASRLGLARAEFMQTPGPSALGEARDALAALEAGLPADHPDIAEACLDVGNMHLQLQQGEQAEQYLRRALSIYKDPGHGSPWELASARLYLARCLRSMGHAEQAEQLLEQSAETVGAADAPEHLRERVCTELSSLLDSEGKHDQAEKVRAKLAANDH